MENTATVVLRQLKILIDEGSICFNEGDVNKCEQMYLRYLLNTDTFLFDISNKTHACDRAWVYRDMIDKIVVYYTGVLSSSHWDIVALKDTHRYTLFGSYSTKQAADDKLPTDDIHDYGYGDIRGTRYSIVNSLDPSHPIVERRISGNDILKFHRV
jgi:hypothetical protein